MNIVEYRKNNYLQLGIKNMRKNDKLIVIIGVIILIIAAVGVYTWVPTDPKMEIFIDNNLEEELIDWLCPIESTDYLAAAIGKRASDGTGFFDGIIDEFKFIKYDGGNEQVPPEVSGPGYGDPGSDIEFTFVTNDPEEDDIEIRIDWGDGEVTDWFGPYDSGEEVTVQHIFATKGTYTIKVKARDELNAESDWGTLDVKIPRAKNSAESKIILIGKISYLEKNEDGDIRFLPVKLLEYTNIIEQGRTLNILDETYGEYPCCGYIQREYFRGIVTEKFIAILWKF